MEKEVIRCRYCRHFLWPERICEKGYGRGWGNDDDDGCTFGKRITNSAERKDKGMKMPDSWDVCKFSALQQKHKICADSD